jgi:hypothetical protein
MFFSAIVLHTCRVKCRAIKKGTFFLQQTTRERHTIKQKHKQKDNIKIKVRQAGNFVVEIEDAGRSIKIVCAFSPTSNNVGTA